MSRNVSSYSLIFDEQFPRVSTKSHAMYEADAFTEVPYSWLRI